MSNLMTNAQAWLDQTQDKANFSEQDTARYLVEQLITENTVLEARIEALRKERDEWEAATRNLLEHYPEDVFPPNSNTPDAKAGTFARRLLTWLLDPVERTRLAALVAEEPMQPTMYPGSSALREWADLHGEQGGGS